MKVFYSLGQVGEIPDLSIALGFFDGVHLGHRVLLKNCISYAKKSAIASAVFTFRKHPKNVISGTNKIKRLLSEDVRNRIFESMGIDYVFALDFADGFHEMSPEAFADDLLRNSFNSKAVFCGYNFHFGARAQGDANMLAALGKQHGFDTSITEKVEVNGRDVSSTCIRTMIEKGKVEDANSLLGADFRLMGTVLHGDGRGRRVGIPTANFEPDPAMVCPAYGVYVTTAHIGGEEIPLPSVTNIGVKPTVGGTKLLAETHIIGYENDLYGKEIEVTFHRYLRKEKMFENFETLVHQISEDKAAAEAFFFK